MKFTFGGSLDKPKLMKMVPSEILMSESKWTRFPALEIREKSKIPTLSDYFTIKRGLATGCNEYFILTSEEIEKKKTPKKYVSANTS